MKKNNLLFMFLILFVSINSCKKDDEPEQTTVATLTTVEVSNITDTTATSGGNITDDGGSTITARGVCYSTSPNPTIADFTTSDGTGTGTFTSNLTGLSPNTTYYVRAYATNAVGTAYGNEISFSTQPPAFPGQTVLVNGGTFQMGSPSGTGESEEHPQHSVTVSSFRISKYEITNQQYADFMNAIGANSDGSYNGTEYLDMGSSSCQIDYTGGQFVPQSGKENYPVIEVSWYGAKAYAEHYGGRLPTEAEWEFAARGGNSSNGYTYSGSDNIDDVAWYYDNSGGGTHTVGTKNANELGIYDMSGNVWEWCNDWYDYDYYSNSPSTDPQGPSTGYYRVVRGGGWNVIAYGCRVALRIYGNPAGTYTDSGFRPVFAP